RRPPFGREGRQQRGSASAILAARRRPGPRSGQAGRHAGAEPVPCPVQRPTGAAVGRRPVHRRRLRRGGGRATPSRGAPGRLRAATLVATDRPSSQQLSLVDPQKLGEGPGLGVCNGDSGGPVFDEHDRSLVGIISWSSRTDGEPVCGFVSGIIPIARYRYWILETAAKLVSPLAP